MESGKDREPRRQLLREAAGGLLLGALGGGALWVALWLVCLALLGRGLDLGLVGSPWHSSPWVGLVLAATGAVIGLIAGIRMELRRKR